MIKILRSLRKRSSNIVEANQSPRLAWGHGDLNIDDKIGLVDIFEEIFDVELRAETQINGVIKYLEINII